MRLRGVDNKLSNSQLPSNNNNNNNNNNDNNNNNHGSQWQEFGLHWMMGQGCVCTSEFELRTVLSLISLMFFFGFSWN